MWRIPDAVWSGLVGAQVNAERRGWKRPSYSSSSCSSSLLIVILVVLWGLSELWAAARERHRRSICRSNLHSSSGCASILYANDFNKTFPTTLGHLYPIYVNNAEVFLCPSAGKATALPRAQAESYTPDMFGDTHTDFVYVSGLKMSDPAIWILAFDDEWNHDGDGVHVLLLCADVEWFEIEKLHAWLGFQERDLAAKGRKMKLLRPAWSSWPRPRPGARLWYLTLRWALRAVAALVLVALISVAIFRARGRRDSGGQDTR